MVAGWLYPSSAYGPAPDLVQPPIDDQELLRRLVEDDGRRRGRAYRRWLILNENYKPLIQERVSSVFSDLETRREIHKFMSVAFNPGLDITRAVSVVYKQDVRRMVTGATEEQQAELDALIRESQWNVLAPQWNRYAFFLGPVTVVPVIRAGQLQWDTLLPHFYEVEPDWMNPLGPLRAVAWTVAERPVWSSRRATGDADVIVLDAVSWRYYRADGGNKFSLLWEEPHGLGVFPGSTFRLSLPLSGDWWQSDMQQRLEDGTVDVGLIATVMNFVRKSQNHKLIAILGDTRMIPGGQKRDPETPVFIPTGSAGFRDTVDLRTLEFDTSPDNFIRHIMFTYESLIEAYGIPEAAVTYSESTSGRIQVSHQGLTEVRNEQIPYARNFEHDLLVRAVALLGRTNRARAVLLPTPEQIQEGLSIEFPKLSRTFVDPRVEMEWTRFEFETGQSSQFQRAKDKHPTLTDEQAEAWVMQNLEELAKFNDEVTKRNLAKGPNGVEGAAEAFGREGPKVRDKDNDSRSNRESGPDDGAESDD